MPRVRVIGSDGEMVGVLTRDEALAMAEEEGLDLVEIQPNADPPVCKIMDFGKFKFEMQKKANEAKKKTKQQEIKELKFRPVTDEGDYQIKLRNMRRFLEEGDKVKVNIRFRGREMSHQELGREMAARIEADLGEDIVIESRPRLEGRHRAADQPTAPQRRQPEALGRHPRQRQGDEGAAVGVPGSEHGQGTEPRRLLAAVEHGRRADLFETDAHALGEERAAPPQAAEGGRQGVFHQVDQAADKVQRPAAEGHLQPLVGAEQVGDHREGGILDPGEQQGRTATGDHPAVDLGDLQVGVHRFVDGQQLVVATEQFEIVTQVDKCRHGWGIRRRPGQRVSDGDAPRRGTGCGIPRLRGGCA